MPNNIIGRFDDKSTAWCAKHKPDAGQYEGELISVLESDHWAAEVGCCKECSHFIADDVR